MVADVNVAEAASSNDEVASARTGVKPITFGLKMVVANFTARSSPSPFPGDPHKIVSNSEIRVLLRECPQSTQPESPNYPPRPTHTLMLARAPLVFVLTSYVTLTMLAQGAVAHRHNPGDPHFCAVAADPNPQRITQPDGRHFVATHVERGPVSYFETVDGYTVERDASDGFYKFVIAAADGYLMLTDVVADEVADLSEVDARLVGAIAPHARVSTAVLAKAQGAKHARQHAGNHDVKAAEKVDRVYGAFPSTGTRRALMLLVDYPDQAHAYDTTDIARLCNEPGYDRNGQTGSLRDYYLDVSYDSLEVNTDVSAWYTAEEQRSYYGVQDTKDRVYDKVPQLVREAVDDAEARGVDFSDYDNDGDGDVDVVLVIHSGRGAEESGSGDDIWSHRWSMSARGGAVTYDGVLVNDYIIQPEIYRAGGKIANIGVLTHEFGHALGLPDLYDTDGGSAGVGRWCLMAGGTWNNNGRTPAQPSAWCKAVMGWTTPIELGTGDSATVTDLPATGAEPGAYQVLTAVPEEYFLVEVRGDNMWDRRLPGSGVVVYHVNESQSTNRDPDRYFVDVEQADGRRDMNLDVNVGDGGDAFPGSADQTEFTCEPAGGLSSGLYDGSDSNVKLTDIRYAGGLGSFTYGSCATVCIYDRVESATAVADCADGTYTQTVHVYAGPSLGGGPVTVTLSDRLGNEYTGQAPTPAAPYTEVAVADIPFGVGTLTLVAEEPNGSCRLVSETPIPRLLACPLANDDVCGAIDLSATINTSDAVYATTSGHGVQVGEPTPMLGERTGERGWGGSEASATAWFTFEAPGSGHLLLESEGAIRVAVYEADSCGALLTPGAYLGVASNDDASARLTSAALTDMRCLLPGRRYYLQIDPDGPGATGDFVLRLNRGRRGCTLADDLVDCAPATSLTSVGSGTWLHVEGEGERVFASVNDLRNVLGPIASSQSKRSGSARRLPDQQPLGNRDYRFSFAEEGPAVLRVYLTSADWEDAQAVLGVSVLSDLVLRHSRYDSCGAAGGPIGEYAAELALERFRATDHLLQYRVPGSGNYFLKAATPLRASFLSFAASAKTEGNELAWTTVDEYATAGFVVQSRADSAADWTDLTTVAATAAEGQGADYLYLDDTAEPRSDYRLRRVDADGIIGYSEIVTVERELVGSSDALLEQSLRLAPNPASTYVTVRVDGEAAIELIDVRGAVLERLPLDRDTGSVELFVGALPGGTYLIRAIGQRGVATRRLVVR